ncbi:hypothetical protein ANN_15312 [Periplaneta americana]|uniref:Reverse transcriptase domain-containing protein n=1 Tax=Periplaneta americana TaxID=6978 RepID=A0ABQ8SGY4_PERAM|nr:hypothetical protein ANN_15312 [Periplaneta americana]
MFCIRQIMEKKWEYKATVHQLFIDFQKAYDSVKREVLYDILIEFGIPKKLVRLIKMCLGETYSRVRIGKAHYTGEALRNATEPVRSGFGLNEAAKKFGVLKATLASKNKYSVEGKVFFAPRPVLSKAICDNAGEMSPGSCTESCPAFAHIGLRENPGKNLNQVTCPDQESNSGHLVSRSDALTVTPQLVQLPRFLHESLSSVRPVYVIDVYKLTPSNGPKERSRRARDLTVASDNLSAIEFRPGDFFFNVEPVIRNEATHRKIVFRVGILA